VTGADAVLPEQYEWILAQFEPEGDPWLLDGIARTLAEDGNLTGAAAVWDRAFGIAPELAEIRQRRQETLERLSVVEHGIRFRYVPAGPFLMGSNDGEVDERPWHPVWLKPFWLAETPVSWEAYCRLMDWEPPPSGCPREWRDNQPTTFDVTRARLDGMNRIRLQYCEDHTTRALDWHAHTPGQMWGGAGGQPISSAELFGIPPRDDPNSPWRYAVKPLIAVSWQEAEDLADRLSMPTVRYGLPTEAQWEKAARGGLIGARHAWGNEPPSADNCDFNRFTEVSILPMRQFAPNGYGLYAMNGGVWEWTRDWYDLDYYQRTPETDPQGPETGEEKVLRGGAWADCADVVTVSFRMSRGSSTWRDTNMRSAMPHMTPTVGFRLCRIETPGKETRP
jgi:formylglycine-generating enzyme required for sulfatase activity